MVPARAAARAHRAPGAEPARTDLERVVLRQKLVLQVERARRARGEDETKRRVQRGAPGACVQERAHERARERQEQRTEQRARVH